MDPALHLNPKPTPNKDQESYMTNSYLPSTGLNGCRGFFAPPATAAELTTSRGLLGVDMETSALKGR